MYSHAEIDDRLNWFSSVVGVVLAKLVVANDGAGRLRRTIQHG